MNKVIRDGELCALVIKDRGMCEQGHKGWGVVCIRS